WPKTTALLLDAIDSIVKPHVPTRITGNLEADLRVALTNLQMRMRKNPFRLVFTALLDHANRDRDLIAAQRRFGSGILQPIQDIITAALQRGDLPSTVHVETASAQLAGPLFLQHVMLRTTISEELISGTITQFLCGMRDGG
ncbi:MAG: TetR-like C-terminal domain-containing protein, partial [SAR324 cluster bacterium]|nr:TetR-like C-terminal domain-containing protein [SAR324 cluster bacterium]